MPNEISREMVRVHVYEPLSLCLAVAREYLPLDFIQIRTGQIERYAREHRGDQIPGCEVRWSKITLCEKDQPNERESPDS